MPYKRYIMSKELLFQSDAQTKLLRVATLLTQATITKEKEDERSEHKARGMNRRNTPERNYAENPERF